MKDYIKNIENAERRYFSETLELREQDGEQYFEGYAAKFGTETDLGGFTESIERGAFDNVLNDDVRGLFNHDDNIVLGRTKSGSMTLTVDDVGQRYTIKYNPNDPDHVKVMEKVKRGDVDQSSFAFTIAEERIEKRSGKPHRSIVKFKRQYDVSPVTYPAYQDTTVAARSISEAIKEEVKPNLLQLRKSIFNLTFNQ